MQHEQGQNNREFRPLSCATALTPDKILNSTRLEVLGEFRNEQPMLVVLAAGKGTRFGREPKCIQPVRGTPLARHSIDEFHRFSPSPAICLVGYCHEDVVRALGTDNIYVLSENPAGGTAFAAYEAFCVPTLKEQNPILIVTMGDRIVPSSVYRRLWEEHTSGDHEAEITILTAEYSPPRNRGKGRILRGEDGQIVGIVEERDILREPDDSKKRLLLNLTEGNCPLYAIRASTLLKYLQDITNDNAQDQYYLTDVIHAISRNKGEIRSITTIVEEPEYDLLCSDVTQSSDLALIEGILATGRGLASPEEIEVEECAAAISTGRPRGQVLSIARQLEELVHTIEPGGQEFRNDEPVAIGISGGRLRIAFMHPDMTRFYGPAWQMPIGAGDELGEEQVVLLMQAGSDHQIHLYPTAMEYREIVNSIPADTPMMFPGDDIADLYAYEEFGTRMSESLLLSLGYFTDEELERRRAGGFPLPPPSRRVSSNMRRPFALIGNAIASLRTLRSGNLGSRVQACLGREHFDGIRIVTTGNIPQGGFSSSSAVTLATKNALNSLFNLDIPPDLLVHLACQAEYGTGVRAGSLDQATEQKGRAGEGALISSNPRDNYRIIGTYPVPTDRFRIFFPYSVERDRAAWRWSWGAYAELPGDGVPTASEMRKLTGKAAEISAILVQLPLSTDFFKEIESDMISTGSLSKERCLWVNQILRAVPLLIRQDELRVRLAHARDWYVRELMDTDLVDRSAAGERTDAIFKSLLSGWQDPILRRTTPEGTTVEEIGVPLRALLAYLFAEVAKNFQLIYHPENWISCVTASQRGDCCVDIDPQRLPTKEEMETEFEWEKRVNGPERLALWLERFDAQWFDYNLDLDDESLSVGLPMDLHQVRGGSFFRGLALIDLAEAMLKRAFGTNAVAVRVNAAGQGDYFQVHVDLQMVDIARVKEFIVKTFYNRFELSTRAGFVEVHSGGGALGVQLSRYEILPQLIHRLRGV